MRTLVISDLHLGAGRGRDLLRRSPIRRSLIAALGGVDRLVLLGDAVELRHDPLPRALDVALPILHELAEALGDGAPIVLVPGNHDHRLIGDWLEQRAARGDAPPLGTETAIAASVNRALAEVARALTASRVTVSYPGVWLREDVYATHGHYLDRHTTVPALERVGAGLMARLSREAPSGPVAAEDYEAALAPMYAWIHSLTQLRRETRSQPDGDGLSARLREALTAPGPRTSIRRLGLGLGFRGLLAALQRAGVGELRTDLSGEELRRAGLRAMGEVTARLGVAGGHVLFGHTHRAGPLPGDDQAEWRTGGDVRLMNTGCWVEEYFARDDARSPYRAGFGVLLEETGPPRLLNLLEERPPSRA